MSAPTVLSIFGRDPVYVGGIELFARELSVQLCERGWRSVLAFSAPPSEAVARLLSLPNTEVETLPAPCALSQRSMREFVRLVRRHRPRIVHMHFTGLLGPYPWLARLAGVEQVILTDHSSRPADHASRRAPAHKRLLARLVGLPLRRVVSVSRFGLECALARDLLPARRFALVYNGVDTGRADAGAARGPEMRRRLGIPGGRTVVAQVSWMIPEKGWEDLLEAARRVLRRNAGVHYLMVGEGPKRAEWMERARECGIAPNVTWTGNVDDPLGAGLFAASDVVCQVSRWQELFGFTIAEAMAARRPVIGTRTGGIPELVRDGETGFLVERGDVAAMAERILALASDGSLRERLGRAGRDAVECHFDLRKNVRQLLGVYGIECDPA